MGKRFNCDFYDQYSSRFRLEIHDENHSGAVTEIRTNGEILEYEPQNGEKVYAPIIAASLEVVIRLNRTHSDAADIIQFLLDMAQEQEGRFWCKLTPYGLSKTIFIGELLIEDVKIPNNTDANVSVTFIDGLAKLDTIDYKDLLGVEFDPTTTETLWGHITNCLSLLPIRSKYSSSATFVEVLMTWFHTGMEVTTTNILEKTRVLHSKFTSIDENGIYSVSSCFQVIVDILKPFNATLLYLVNEHGNYLITHFSNLSEHAIPERIGYNTNFQGFILPQRTNLNGVGNKDLTGGMYSFLPGLKQINMNFSYNRTPLEPNFHNQTNEPAGYTQVACYTVTSDAERIVAWGNLSTAWTSAQLIPFDAWGVFQIYIKVESATKTRWCANNFTYQLNGAGWMVGNTSGGASWKDTEDSNSIETSHINWQTGNIQLNDVFILTPSLAVVDEFPIGEEIKVSIKFDFYGKARSYPFSPAAMQPHFDMIDYQRAINVALIESDDASNTETTGLTITGLFNENNSREQDYDIVLGYGQNSSASNLEINTGTEWITASNKWKKTTGEKYLYELILEEMYRLRKDSIESYEGLFRGPNVFGMMLFRMDHGNQEYLMPLRGRHDIGGSTFNGRFIVPNIFAGSPIISISEINETSSVPNSSSSTTSGSTGSSYESNYVKIPFRKTGIVADSITINDVKVVDHIDFENEQMQLYIYLQRGNVPLIYEKSGQLQRSEYSAQPQGSDTLITLGKTSKATDIFIGWIIQT